tara:strand:- start:1000 stop:1509 length:510 start_codon:yes stop_codon:yes gene_type:complete
LKKNLVLIGMMGVGKSTIGRLLSKKLDIPFEDLDRSIEKMQNLKISEIFRSKGEAYFRKIEEKECLKIIKKKGRIIALGGGTFMNERIRKNIMNKSLTVWLNLPPDEIFNRIKKNKKRPLLANAKSKKDVEKIYLKRKKIYSLADFELNCKFKNKEQIVNEIKIIYENI